MTRVSGLAVALAGILVAFAAAGAVGVPVFGQAKTVATQTGVGGLSEIQAGDLNGDGLDDLVVTRIAYPNAHQTFPVGIYLANRTGGFVDGSSMWDGSPPRTEHGRQIIVGDFNGDHRNDVFVADHGYDLPPFPGHPNALALSTPAGKLVDASGNMPPESGFSHSATAADVNRDGSIDIYIGNVGGGDHTPPEILLNDGSGHFTRRLDLLPAIIQDAEGTGRYTRSLFVDLNGDGAPDLVLGAEDHTPNSRVLLNDGSGHFHFVDGVMPPKPFGARSILISLATLDVNRDGHPDLLAGFQREDFSGRRIQVLIGDGTGMFRDETAQRLPSQDEGAGWPYAIRLADINGDGHLDFGVSVNGAYTERAPLYLDDGTGIYHPVQAPSSRPFFVFADPNGDGHPDIASAEGGTTEQIDVQLQLALPTTPPRIRFTARRDRIRVSWTAVRGATGYEIWRSAPRQTRRQIGTTPGLRFDDPNTKRGIPYTYVVRAKNELGTSVFSVPAAGRRR